MTAENIKEKTNQKLSDIIDHIKLIEEMILEEEYCTEILNELSDINASLISVGAIIVRDHLETNLTDNLNNKDLETQYDELMNIIYKLT